MTGAVVIPFPRFYRRGVFVEPKQGKRTFCGECGLGLHAHIKVACAECGKKFRACPFRASALGFDRCAEHAS